MKSKSQATIPKKVRRVLHLEKSDRIIVISRASDLDLDYLRSISKTMNEWDSDEDDRAFGNL